MLETTERELAAAAQTNLPVVMEDAANFGVCIHETATSAPNGIENYLVFKTYVSGLEHARMVARKDGISYNQWLGEVWTEYGRLGKRGGALGEQAIRLIVRRLTWSIKGLRRMINHQENQAVPAVEEETDDGGDDAEQGAVDHVPAVLNDHRDARAKDMNLNTIIMCAVALSVGLQLAMLVVLILKM